MVCRGITCAAVGGSSVSDVTRLSKRSATRGHTQHTTHAAHTATTLQVVTTAHEITVAPIERTRAAVATLQVGGRGEIVQSGVACRAVYHVCS